MGRKNQALGPANWQADFVRTYEDAFKQSGVACWGLRAPATKTACRQTRSGWRRDTRYEKTAKALAKFGLR
jgi:hypothetical protein